MAVRDVASRADGYGMPGVVVDGSDVLACYREMRMARERAIRGDGPTLIECKTYRYLPHTSDDDDKSYRSREEVDRHKHDDPIDKLSSYLIDHDVADEERLRATQDEVKAEVDEAITAAWAAPDPDPGTAMRHVFAEDTGA
jgi:2-oxoisovalerate dehydrogenase E1 component alpha subunit